MGTGPVPSFVLVPPATGVGPVPLLAFVAPVPGITGSAFGLALF